MIIPIYKSEPGAIELVSLRQCIRVLKNYPIIFIGPYKLVITAYMQICEGQVLFEYIPFGDNYFSGIAGYNKLMLLPEFYKTFISYRYILIHQLDAYVFKDELSFWCRKNFDFIGAPAPEHQNRPGEMQFLSRYGKFINGINRVFKTRHKISNVGNGGFSLRKTKKCYLLLMLLKFKATAWGANNEDGFFKYWGNLLYPFFKLPDDETALRFAIEQSPAESFEKLGCQLPFGCHAFEKYEPDFWKHYIPLINK